MCRTMFDTSNKRTALIASRTFALLLVACTHGGTYTYGSKKLSVDVHDHGPTRLLTFVSGDDGSADFALPLPGGDWLATVHGTTRIAPSGEPRWTKPVALDDALVDGDTIIVVGNPPGGQHGASQGKVVTALDAVGNINWQTAAGALPIGMHPRIVKTPSSYVVAAEAGAGAVDAAGQVRWSIPHDPPMASAVLAAATSNAVAIIEVPSTITSTDVQNGTIKPDVCIARLVDAATGAVRATTPLPLAGHRCMLGGLAARGDALAVAYRDERITYNGEVQSSITTSKVAILDAATLAVRATVDVDPSRELADPPAALARDEVAFLDSYATRDAQIALTIVDVATHRLRRARMFSPHRYRELDDSTIQLLWISNTTAGITFAGIYAGEIVVGTGGALHSNVQRVDSCAAARHIECTEGHGTTLVAPFAGVIGALDYR